MATATKTGVRNYKRILGELESLRGQSGLAAHRRASLLVQVFEDGDLRSDVGAKDDFAVCEFLDQYVEDLCLSFTELRAMLSEFPDADSWSDGKLATLYETARQRIIERGQTGEEKPPRHPRRVTIEQYEAVESERQGAEARAAFLDKRISAMEKENEELRAENNRLKGRIEQLEKILASRS